MDRIAKSESEFTLGSGVLSVRLEDMVYTTRDEALILDYLGCESKKTTFEAKSAYKFAFERGRSFRDWIFPATLRDT